MTANIINKGNLIKPNIVKSISGDSLKISGDNKSYHSPIYEITHKLDTVIGKVIFKLF